MFIVRKSFVFIAVGCLSLSLHGCLILDATTDTTTQVTNALTHATTDILSSTSGDADTATNYRVKKLKMFANINSLNLQQDIAQGRGEYLSSLERLLEVPTQRHDEFVQFAQSNYEAFYGREAQSTNEILAKLARFGSDEISQALYVQVAKK